jgi:hypothetical protein
MQKGSLNESAEGLQRMRFHATLLLNGKTATGIQVPDDVVAALGSSKKPPVRVTIRDTTYRTTVAVVGEAFMIPISEEIRKKAGIAAGDELEVEIEPDLEPREVTVPPDLADALAQDVDAKRFFEGLSYSNKRRFVLSIEDAKTAETRQRRILKAITMLREGRI